VTRKKLNPGYLDELADWRPRRPTALLLDDPLRGDAAKVVEILGAQARHYSFPVRLLVVSQTLPEELDFEPTDDSTGWTSRDEAFYGTVVVLSEDSRLSRREILHIAQKMPSLSRWKEHDPEVERSLNTLIEITRGNPMLVELALRLLRRGVPIDHLSASDLISDRALRVYDALKLASPSIADSDLRVLASATLAGPVRGDSSDNSRLGKARSALFEHREALKRCLNLDRMETLDELPAVRPERIGDAFLQFVLANHCDTPSTQVEVAVLAWQLNDRGVLRSIGRTAAGSDDLGRIMRVAPPDNVRVETFDLALAYSAAAIRIPFHRKPPLDRGLEIAKLASGKIGELSPRSAATILPQLVTVAEADGQGTRIRNSAAYVCFFTAMRRALDDDQFASDSESLEHWMKVAGSFWRSWGDWGALAGVLEVKNAFAGVEALALRAESIPEPRPVTLEEWTAKNWFRVAENRRFLEDGSGLELAESRVTAILHRWPDNHLIAESAAGTRIIVGQFWAMNGDLSRSESAIKGAIEIAEEFGGDDRFELCRAWALKALGLAKAVAGDAPAAEAIAFDVEAMQERLADRLFIGEVTAEAWVNVILAAARSGNLEMCRQALAKVEAIADLGGRTEELQELRVKALNNLCTLEAVHGNLADCQRAATQAELIASAFPENVDICNSLANLLVSVSRVANFFCDYSACNTVVQRLCQLTDPFRGIAHFDQPRANGLVNLCRAKAMTSDVPGCALAAKRVEEIADMHPRVELFDEIRVKALLNVALSHFVVEDLPGCEVTTSRVEEFVEPYIEKESFRLQYAVALCFVALLKKNVGNADDAKMTLNRAEELTARFAGSEKIEGLLKETRSIIYPADPV
jgi:hypothetical protein